MKANSFKEKGRGLVGLLFWVAVIALLGWLGYQLYLHPESLNPKPAAHNAYEDRPTN